MLMFSANLGHASRAGFILKSCEAVFVFCFFVMHAPLCSFGSAGNPEKPNVLLILSDDHSVPHLGCYGDSNCKRFNISPNLDAFAKQAMSFRRAYTTSPQCAPSRISIFAGRSPVALGVTRFAQPPRSDVLFFTDLLRDNGYWVGLDGRHQHLDGRAKEDKHIDDVLQSEGMQDLENRFDHFVRSAKTKGAELPEVGRRLNAALDQVPDQRPFFLYFGFNQPHRRFGKEHDRIDPAQLNLPEDWPDLPEVRVDYARYLAEVRDLDFGFGLILEALRSRGIEKNTIVIFMGDNGEALLRGKGALHPRGIHVPLMIRWPGKVKAGSESHALVSGLDLGATILDAVGIGEANEVPGHSFFLELVSKTFNAREYVFAERGWHWGPITRTDGLDLSRSITTQQFHLIYNALPCRAYTPVDMSQKDAWLAVVSSHDAGHLSSLHEKLYFQKPRPIIELYDLQSDPLALNNLSGQDSYREIQEQLRKELERWMIREHDYLPLPSHALLHER